MKILCMDTTAKVSSVSIVNDEKILGEYQVHLPFTHSQTAMPMVEQLLKTCGFEVADMDAFAVSTGPGSFTGLRISLAAIKGMAFAVGKPCIGISTLDALAQNVADTNGTICAVMDARCRQVYQALYQAENGVVTKLTEDRAIFLSDLTEELMSLKKSIILVGDGADLCYNELKDVLPDLHLASPQNRYQRASSVGQLALQKLNDGLAVDASAILPQYLRLPQAERERNARLKSQGERS